MPSSEKKVGWGGKREGAGRPPLESSIRQEIASGYFERKEELRNRGNSWQRKNIIRELMAKHGVTPRMVERCRAEYSKIWQNFQWHTTMYNYAIEGAEIQPLPTRIENLKPGVYADKKKLRLRVDSAGNWKWIFPFFSGSTFREKILGGRELSRTMARELATEAGRKLAAGQNPIDGSWSSAALERVKTKKS